MKSARGDRASARRRSRLALAVAAVALVAPASSSAVTIDFESLAPGATVNAQYSGQGVTFNGSRVFTYGAAAHSGTKGIENCRGVEFCGVAPFRAEFTTGQTTVGAWVGYNASLAAARTVRLRALDDADNLIGSSDIVLPANAGTTPATNHLTFTAPGATIRALEVTMPGFDTYDVFLDDIEFSTAGPPPPCSASGPPFVNLTSPAEGAYLQNNQVLLKGVVNNRGAPITEASVISEGTTTRTAIGFPTPIGASGGAFAIYMGGLLQSGNQKIRVTATNCAGTGTSSNPAVTYNPLPTTAGFQQLAPVELIQTVQSPYNPTPLIASGPNGTKRTMARVQLTATGVSVPITGVSGRLTATRPDGSRPGGPLTIDSLNTISVAPDQTLEAARSSMDNTLNFELPPEWQTEGRLHVQLEQLRIEGFQTVLPCVYCDNYGGISAVKTFHRVPPLRIWLVAVPYRDASGTVQAPQQRDFDFLTSWLRRAYPASELQITQSAMPTRNGLPGDCHDVNDDLGSWAATMPAQPRQTRYYGLVSDGGGFMRGCANIGGRTGSGPAGCCRWGWDTDTIYTDWYGGHEIGHMYDRRHPGSGCGETDDDDDFPYGFGQLGSFAHDNQGLDFGDAPLTGVPMTLLDWRTGAHDVMTYCDDQWSSAYTYNGILRNLCGNDRANCPNHGQLTKTGVSAKKGGTRLSVLGSINLENNRTSLDTMSALRGLTLTERPRKSAYAIVLRNASGRAVGSYPFAPKEISDLPERRRLATIDEVVPFAAKARRIEIVKGNEVLASRTVSAHAPTVKLRSPKGKRLRKPVKLRWTSRDADGDRPLATLQYAADGKRFVTIAADLRKGKYKVDPDNLPGGDKARFRVVVTDGVLTGIDKTKSFKVAAKAPRISIATPVEGTTLTEGQSLQLVASVTDEQDARIADDVVWTSDVQGELGRGPAVNATLQPGAHRLFATVTNSLGVSSQASVGIIVEATPPTVDAQLVP